MLEDVGILRQTCSEKQLIWLHIFVHELSIRFFKIFLVLCNILVYSLPKFLFFSPSPPRQLVLCVCHSVTTISFYCDLLPMLPWPDILNLISWTSNLSWHLCLRGLELKRMSFHPLVSMLFPFVKVCRSLFYNIAF